MLFCFMLQECLVLSALPSTTFAYQKATGKRMIRILIAEDEKPISNLIRLSLSKAGYFCDCAYDA